MFIISFLEYYICYIIFGIWKVIIESLFNCICIDYDNIEDEENQFILKKFDDDRIDFEKKYNQATTEIIEQFYQNKWYWKPLVIYLNF